MNTKDQVQENVEAVINELHNQFNKTNLNTAKELLETLKRRVEFLERDIQNCEEHGHALHNDTVRNLLSACEGAMREWMNPIRSYQGFETYKALTSK